MRKWWDQNGASQSEIESKYRSRITGQTPVSCFLIVNHDRPVGYVQAYWLDDFKDHSAWRCAEANHQTASLDVFIGELDSLRIGIATSALEKFLGDFVFGTMKAARCIVGPYEANEAAIRTYQRAGFRHLKTMEGSAENPAEYLMQIERGSFPKL